MPYLSKRKVGNPNKIEQKESQDRHNNKWNVYYQDKRWKKLRDWYKLNHPICEICAINGRSVPAEEVHHRIAFSTGNTEEERMSLLLNPDNLQCLCRQCHMKIHNHKM